MAMVSLLGLVAAAIVVPASVITLSGTSAQADTSGSIAIVNATGREEGPILDAMNKSGPTKAEHHLGYTFNLGTINHEAVISVECGQMDPTAELCTHELDTVYHPKAAVFSGTAGSSNNKVKIGDVVISGYAVSKSGIEYQDDPPKTPEGEIPYHAVEIKTDNPDLNIGGAIHPANASPPKGSTYVSAFAATFDLVHAATKASLAKNQVIVGTVGDAPVFTETRNVIESQNMLYQTDVEENEGFGFAFANAVHGVPWVVIRGISDSPFGGTTDKNGAAEHAADVAIKTVQEAPDTVSKSPADLGNLNGISNALRAGYIVADQVDFHTAPVTKLQYTDQSKKTHTLSGKALGDLEASLGLPRGG
jgi:adenosylhomocysteine nucleosidase